MTYIPKTEAQNSAIQLYHAKNYINEPVSLTINFADCSELEIISDNHNSNEALVALQVGSDTTASNYVRTYMYANSSLHGGRDTYRVFVSYLGGSFTRTIFGKTSKVFYTHWMNGLTTSNMQTGLYTYKYIGSDTSQTITLVSYADYYGQLRIYKKS